MVNSIQKMLSILITLLTKQKTEDSTINVSHITFPRDIE